MNIDELEVEKVYYIARFNINQFTNDVMYNDKIKSSVELFFEHINIISAKLISITKNIILFEDLSKVTDAGNKVTYRFPANNTNNYIFSSQEMIIAYIIKHSLLGLDNLHKRITGKSIDSTKEIL